MITSAPGFDRQIAALRLVPRCEALQSADADAHATLSVVSESNQNTELLTHTKEV
jgi:hypothetical protein